MEIDHEIISTVILLPSADLFKKGCCQLQAKVCAQITGYNSFLVYCRELALGTVSLTSDRAQGDDGKHDSHYNRLLKPAQEKVWLLFIHDILAQ